MCVCVSACVYGLCMFANMCACECICVWKFILDVFHYFSTLFTEESSLIEPETSRFSQPSYPDYPWDSLSLPHDD